MDRRANGGGANSTKYGGDGEEIVDFPELWKEFFEVFTDREACLAALHELRTQQVAAGITL